MNFSLRNLEKEVSEEALLEGEALFETGKVNDLKELEKNLWIAQSDGFEVEIQLSGLTVVDATCECATFREVGMCGHLAATFLQLRKDKEKQKSQRKKKKPSVSRLTTGIILDQIDPDELVAFVREYARTHRNFSIALKARFASNVSNLNSREKYVQLLETTINSVRKQDRIITLRGAQRLIKVINELNAQAERSLATGDLIEVADIAISIIRKVTPVLTKVQRKREEIRALLVKNFEYLLTITNQAPAPKLLELLWEDCLGEYAKRTYHNNQLDHYFFKIMLRVANTTQQLETLLSIVQEHASVFSETHESYKDYILIQIAVLEQLGSTDAARKLVEEHINTPAVLEFALDQAQKAGNRPREKALAQFGLELELPESEKNKLESRLLKIAESEGDALAIHEYALRQFLRNLDLHDYEKARQHIAPELRLQLFEDTLTQLRERPYSIEIRDTLSELLIIERQWEILLAYAIEIQSLDLLTTIDVHLLSRFPEQVKQLYQQLLHDYARHYVGPKTARRIGLALEHLETSGAQGLAKALATELIRQNPERHTLAAELAKFEE